MYCVLRRKNVSQVKKLIRTCIYTFIHHGFIIIKNYEVREDIDDFREEL